ncbi:MAG: hypothetical protein KKA42_10000 [candidate division Zixibacteria bacterium]|nr:hypothetical protein [candidate division Zixibacteria bacterium]
MVDRLNMKRIALLAAWLLLPVIAAQASEFVQLAGEVRIPVPDQWILGTDTVNYPFQLVYVNDGAEILVFRNDIEEAERVTDEIALRETVDNIISDIVTSVPDARLLTSTGFNDGFRVGFIVEFRSTDSTSGAALRQRMRGILYLHPDGHQILFTVWSKTTRELYPAVEAAIGMVEDEFTYLGPHEASAFGSNRSYYWPLATAVLLVIGSVLFFRARRRHGGLPDLPEDSHFWRCGCGRLNHESKPTCRRCGRDKLAVDRADT